MAYQFFHVECYARSAPAKKTGGATPSISSIVGEANRIPGNCPHVPSPESPVLIYGCPLEQVEVLASEWAHQAKDTKGRALRKDGLVLLAGVISAPETLTSSEWGRMRADSVDYLKSRFGERLKSVIEHKDEPPHWHIHFYCIPNIGQRFDSLHAGREAAAIAKEKGELKGDQNKAYKNAMRSWQDEFFQQVGMKHGLARIGPARRRLTRAQWQQEQLVARTTASCLREQSFAQSVVNSIETRASKVLSAEKKILSEKKAVAASLAKLEFDIAKWGKLGSRIGTLWSALIMGAAGLMQKARALIEKSALADLQKKMANAALFAQQEIKRASAQAADDARHQIANAMREERIVTTRLRSDLTYLREIEAKRLAQETAALNFSGRPAPRLSLKIRG